MKKYIIILFLFLFSLFANSQTTTFNKLYAPSNNPNTAYIISSIIPKGSGYIASGTAFDTININNPSLFFYKIDSAGNVSKIRSFSRLGWNYYYNISSLIELKNGGYFYIGEMDTINHNPEHFLIRFDANMYTLWTKIIPNDSVYWEKFGQMYETSDHGFIFVGAKENNPNNLWVMLVKTDSMGNMQWKKTIPMPNYSGGAQIMETPDKGFLINGYSSSDAYKDGDPFIIKTDSAGNQEWLKYFGGIEYDGAGAVVATNDGNYLYAYGYSTYTYPFNEFWKARLNVIKFAPNGNIIWSRFYDSIRMVLNIGKIEVLPNNDFIVMGLNSERDSFSFFSSFMFKFKANGDSLWRKIYYLKDGYVDENTLLDNVLNTDGGITACGWVSSDTQVPYQQIWILKTDSNGYAPGPQNVSIIDLPYLQVGYGGMKVFPNPANDFVVISYEINNAINSLRLVILNATGKTVYDKELNKPKDELLITLKDYAKGNYLVTLFNNGKVVNSSKIVIQ